MTLVKSAYQKTNFLISQPKHMLSVILFGHFYRLIWESFPIQIKALRVLMGTAVFKRASLQIGIFLV